nr:methyl-accepting chemotaxis protein [Ralstonia sp. ASV6]
MIEGSAAPVGWVSNLVAHTGKTMGEDAVVVKHVTNIMGEISAGWAEQSSGIEQINEAVTQMDDVAQQSAAPVE